MSKSLSMVRDNFKNNESMPEKDRQCKFPLFLNPIYSTRILSVDKICKR